jgi:hypothetical protein
MRGWICSTSTRCVLGHVGRLNSCPCAHETIKERGRRMVTVPRILNSCLELCGRLERPDSEDELPAPCLTDKTRHWYIVIDASNRSDMTHFFHVSSKLHIEACAKKLLARSPRLMRCRDSLFSRAYTSGLPNTPPPFPFIRPPRLSYSGYYIRFGSASKNFWRLRRHVGQ